MSSSYANAVSAGKKLTFQVSPQCKLATEWAEAGGEGRLCAREPHTQLDDTLYAKGTKGGHRTRRDLLDMFFNRKYLSL